jgi:signal transduction histidine kinase
MNPSSSIRLLYMEDDVGTARLLQKTLERAGFRVTLARDGAEGLSLYDSSEFDVIAVDQHMPNYDGLAVIRELLARGPLPPLIMITGTGDEAVAVDALKLGAGDYIVKDVDGHYLELLPSVIEQVQRQHQLVEQTRQNEVALRRYAAELEARNEELGAFAHTVAHDLTNPLGLIMGFAETLATYYDSLTDEQRVSCADSILRGSRKMNRIIEELLLLAGVRERDVECEPLDMGAIVAEAQQRITDQIEANHATLVVPATWPLALGYGPWIEEVWVNYLTNALKYGGQPPHIELGADQLSDGLIRFWTRDYGIGIPPEAQARLFTPYTRFQQTSAKGHGLGLSIVRRIVEKLGGRVGVESEVGQGSLFFFTLPAAT